MGKGCRYVKRLSNHVLPLQCISLATCSGCPQGHVSYKVTTKTKLPQYKKEHTEVIRRFRDFAWLWQRLQDTNRGLRLAADCMHLMLAPAPILAMILDLFIASLAV